MFFKFCHVLKQGCINQIEDSFSNFQHGRVVYHRNGGLGYLGANI